MVDGLVIIFYQGYMCINLFQIVLFTVKQVLVWVCVFNYYSAISFVDFGTFLIAILCVLIFLFGYCYFDYVKDIEMCGSQIEIEITNEKISNIVQALPDCFIVIDENLKSLFYNPNYIAMVKEKTFSEFLLETRYHKRYYNCANTEDLISDIRDAFSYDLGVEINFGIIQKNQEFIE